MSISISQKQSELDNIQNQLKTSSVVIQNNDQETKKQIAKAVGLFQAEIDSQKAQNTQATKKIEELSQQVKDLQKLNYIITANQQKIKEQGQTIEEMKEVDKESK